MKSAVTWTLLAVGAAALVAVAAVASIPWLVDTARVRSLIAGAAAQSLGRPVSFSSIHVSVVPLPAVVLRDVEVAEDPAFGPGAFIRLSEARVRLRLWPLLLLRVELGDFVLERPAIVLAQSADGRWNFATLGPSSASGRRPARGRGSGGPGGAGAVFSSRVLVHAGAVVLERRAGERTEYRVDDIDLTASPEAAGITFQGSATLRPGDVSLKIADGSLALAPARGVLDAPIGGRVTLRGSSLRALVAPALGPEPAIDGGLEGTFTLGGTVGRPRATGDVESGGLGVSRVSPRCPEPRRRTLQLGPLRARVTLEERRVTAWPFTTTLGGAEVKGNLALPLGAGRVEVTDVSVARLPVERVLVDVLCESYAITGPLDLRGAVGGHTGDPWRTAAGHGEIRVGPGKIVGAEALALIDGVLRLPGAVSSVLRGNVPTLGHSPIDYESITATYRITGGVLATRDLRLTSRLLQASAAGTWALASGGLDFDVRVRLASGELRAKVTGTAESPSIRLADAGGLRDVDPERARRGLEDLLKRFR